MRRLRPVMAVVCVTFGVGWFAGCEGVSTPAEAKEPSLADVPPVPARVPRVPKGAAPTSGGPKGTLIFDPFATRFAVVDFDPPKELPKQAIKPPSCNLGASARSWVPVRPITEEDGAPTEPGRGPGSEKGSQPRALGPGLGWYCVYRWDGKALPSQDDFRAINAVPDSTQVRTNPGGAADQSKLPEGVTGPLLKIFDHQANGASEAAWNAARKARDRRLKGLAARLSGEEKKLFESVLTVPSVAVAVVDATPRGPDFQDPSRHGYAVENVIARLFCPTREAACLKQIRPHLALPMLDSNNFDAKNGGFFGRFSQLADALVGALNAWEPTKEHLVINLSLGWDPLKTDKGDRNETRIIQLLNRASCLGALIVGASGNPTGTDGPILPGGFEELKAPTSAECQQLADKTHTRLPQFALAQIPAVKKWVAEYGKASEKTMTAYRPLIHSVGALDLQDQRLMADRRWGQPRMSALGLFVTVPVPGPSAFTPLFSGTSMPTAIVSGIAAAVWSMRPELSAAEVMSLVYAGGVELDGGIKSKRARTEFCTGEHFGPCATQSKVHRAFLCGALAAASTEPGQSPAITCDQSVSTERITWPPVAKSTGTALNCRVPNCGLSSGPGPSHQVADVFPHGAFGACPGCKLTINKAGIGTLTGTPGLLSAPHYVGAKLVVNVLEFSDTPIPYSVSMPVLDKPMSIPMGTMPDLTSGAYLTFHFDLGGGFEPDDPIYLDVQWK